jgi:hypothetical protein
MAANDDVIYNWERIVSCLELVEPRGLIRCERGTRQLVRFMLRHDNALAAKM